MINTRCPDALEVRQGSTKGEIVRGVRWVALVAAVVVALGATAGTAAQGATDEAPKATDVGITADEIRIAVMADVDNPIAPNLFKGSADAVKGFAKYIKPPAGWQAASSWSTFSIRS